MIVWKRGCAAAACLLIACCEVQADQSLDDIAQAATAAPLQLKLAERMGWTDDIAWPPANRKEFIAAIWPHAERAAKTIGVTPHALAAQAALESGWGRRVAIGLDGQPTYNLFGIKAGASWDGDRIEVATHEFIHGKRRPKIADFRAYESIAECFADYVAMLKANPRYASALKHGGTSRHFAARLQRAGYSTDPRYARKVHEIANSSLLRAPKMAGKQGQSG
jgi:flagellar protein FlgJ